MDTDRWQRVKEIFLATVQRKPHERDAFLDEACLNDPDLRMEVETMLSSHEESESFLELPTQEGGAKVGLTLDRGEEDLLDAAPAVLFHLLMLLKNMGIPNMV